MKSAMPAAPSPAIAVVGSINMDLVFRTPRMPLPGETLHGQEFLQIPGGKGANQAVAAARMGAAVKFIARVGDDAFGAQMLRGFEQDGIDISQVRTTQGTATGVAGILVDAQGQNSIVLASGANGCLSRMDIAQAAPAIASAKALLCQLETPMDSVADAIACAKQHDVAVILNPAPARALDPSLLAQVDYLILNETEATQLSGIVVSDVNSARAAAHALRQLGVATILLTLGEHGVYLCNETLDRHLPALKVQAVDTTAAGDTFVGAFAVGLCHGLPLEHACMQAQTAAALAVSKLGAQTSIPHRAEVLQLMAERAGKEQ